MNTKLKDLLIETVNNYFNKYILDAGESNIDNLEELRQDKQKLIELIEKLPRELETKLEQLLGEEITEVYFHQLPQEILDEIYDAQREDVIERYCTEEYFNPDIAYEIALDRGYKIKNNQI